MRVNNHIHHIHIFSHTYVHSKSNIQLYIEYYFFCYMKEATWIHDICPVGGEFISIVIDLVHADILTGHSWNVDVNFATKKKTKKKNMFSLFLSLFVVTWIERFRWFMFSWLSYKVTSINMKATRGCYCCRVADSGCVWKMGRDSKIKLGKTIKQE